jgi:hypothetical protein
MFFEMHLLVSNIYIKEAPTLVWLKLGYIEEENVNHCEVASR